MPDKIKPRLLFVYDYFYPGYRAGGPIQSLVNLANSLQHDYEIRVLCSATDLNSPVLYAGVTTDAWNRVQLPGSTVEVLVWYAGAGNLNKATIRQLVAAASPEVVYLNGIFSYRFFVLPLLALKKNKSIRIVVCPRGMLQAGALALKSTKKKMYLSWLSWSGLLSRVNWHATNAEEQESIQLQFGKQVPVHIAANIPKAPVAAVKEINKKKGELRLVYLSLLAGKKNLLALVEVVTRAGSGISLDIYGPVKDEAYWAQCKHAMTHSKGRVTYKGEVLPPDVQEVFSRYDASALLTRGENFGHAIYESLSSGRPVITSYFTPWNNLEQQEAGWNVDIASPDDIIRLLNRLAALDQTEFERYYSGAHRMARAYMEEIAGTTSYAYHRLFGKGVQ